MVDKTQQGLAIALRLAHCVTRNDDIKAAGIVSRPQAFGTQVRLDLRAQSPGEAPAAGRNSPVLKTKARIARPVPAQGEPVAIPRAVTADAGKIAARVRAREGTRQPEMAAG